MSVENGHLVALNSALYHSVPAHVHELRGRASQLATDNDELMSYAYSERKALKLNIYEQRHTSAHNVIAFSNENRGAFRCYLDFHFAGRFDKAPQTKLQKEIAARVDEDISKFCPEIDFWMLNTDIYLVAIKDVVWYKRYVEETSEAETTAFQKMRDGTRQKLGIWKTQKVQGSYKTACTKVRRTKKSKPVDPTLSWYDTELNYPGDDVA